MNPLEVLAQATVMFILSRCRPLQILHLASKAYW